MLCWHVDYWDRLGWPDPYASAEATRRQRRYKEVQGFKTFGTPQFFIANEPLPWEKDAYARIDGLVDEAAKAPSPVRITAEATLERGVITVGIRLALTDREQPPAETVRIVPILVRKAAETAVDRGENEHRTLTEYFTVIEAKSPMRTTRAFAKGTRTTFTAPEGVAADGLSVALLIEDTATQTTLECISIAVEDVAPVPAADGTEETGGTAGASRIPQAHVDEAVAAAGANAPELQRVLEHFAGDEQRSEAARFLIANMPDKGYITTVLRDSDGNEVPWDSLAYPTYKDSLAAIEALEKKHGTLDFDRGSKADDVETITAQFLVRHIDQAFAIWLGTPGSQRVGFEAFLNFVLPYRGSQEPLDDWLSPLRERFAAARDEVGAEGTLEDLYKLVSKDAGKRVRFNERWYLHPTDQSFSEMLDTGQGRCEDITNMTTFAARAVGLATAADYTPYGAHRDNNHAWNVLLDTDGRGFAKSNAHAAKVYRKTFAIQRDSLPFVLAEGREPPNRFMGSKNAVDVTDQYRETTDVGLVLDAERHSGEQIAYLCVFNGGDWKAIQWSRNAYGAVSFARMGRNILYLPAVVKGKTQTAAGAPTIVTKAGEVIRLPGTSAAAEVLVTSVRPRQKSVDTGEETPVSHLKAGTVYVVQRWAPDGWGEVATFTAGTEPERVTGLAADGLYWIVAKESRRLERPFTIEKGRQRFW